MSVDEIQELKNYIDERSRDIETTLLREFRKWAVRVVSDSKVQKAATLGLSEDRIIRTLERDLIDIQRKHAALREEMNARWRGFRW